LRAAVEAVDGGVADVRLVVSWPGEEHLDPIAEPASNAIRVRAVAEDAAEGPRGVADTIVECDVSASGGAKSAEVRGELREAEIQMRRTRPDIKGPQPLSAEEWVGALMHELGHALGFAGHAAHGDSLLVLEQGTLRRLGRRALAGETQPEPSLEALYRLEPGRTLGVGVLTPASSAWLERVTSGLAALAARGEVVSGPRARVGDREAQLEWRVGRDRRVLVRMPLWVQQVRQGAPILALPDRETRSWLREQESYSSTDGSIERARSRH
jgi:hypothetical protein